MTIALIPVKRLEESKSRLLPQLPDEQRQALTLAMLADLIEALRATPGIERIAVTTPDPLVAEKAKAAGAEILMHPEPGLNRALEAGRARLFPETADGGAGREDSLLIVLGDVAGALAEDFARLLAEADREGAEGVWLAPSSDGGTSALLQRPPHRIPCRFGRASARHHREAAESAGVAFRELCLPSLAIDLDASEDLEAFLAAPSGGPRTRRLLESLRSALRSDTMDPEPDV